jgi:hypothetical protein
MDPPLQSWRSGRLAPARANETAPKRYAFT